MDWLQGLKVFEKNFRVRLEVEDLARNWKELYKDLDIREQLILANNWCLGNPNRAPKANFIRFLNAWMKLANQWAQKIPRHKTYAENLAPSEDLMTLEDIQKMKEAIRWKR